LNLEQKIRRGLAYVFLSTLGSRAVSFIADIALMRLLLPEQHGAMAFGMLMVSSLALLRSLGVGEALIFHREIDQESCDTAFALSAVLAIVLYAIVFFGAPWLALWLAGADSLAVVELLRVLGVLVVLQGLGNVPSALLERELAFDKKIYVDALPTFAYALLAVGLAWSGYGVWSMVWGRLLASSIGLVAAWLLSPWRPRWNFDWLRLRQLGAYGRYVSAAAIVSFFVVSVDDLLVGRLGGQLELGYYARAYLIANLPVTAVAHVASRVAFPAYARLAGEGGDVATMYRHMLGGVALLTLPMALSIVLLARPFTESILGPVWGPMVPLMQCLGVFSFMRSLLSNTGPLFNALGKPSAILKTNILQLVLLGVVLYPLVEAYGALGAALAIVLCSMVSAPLALYYVHSIAGVSWGQQLAIIRPLLLPACVAALCMLGLRAALHPAGGLVVCIGAGAIGFVVYGLLLYRWQRPALMQALALVSGRSQ
jgi:O-antigen/teichoic acid export membrane protein